LGGVGQSLWVLGMGRVDSGLATVLPLPRLNHAKYSKQVF
jgi:hypothetical protein